jgi:hypothetical protein
VDYKKIHKRFIESRRITEASLIQSGDYVERHHILPRSLGGSDDADNVIVLNPGDHLFAHLLLAQIYGGKMWLAVKAMLDFEPDSKTNFRRITNKRFRKQYAFARKRAADWFSENFSGQNHPLADTKEYTLVNQAGESVTGNRTVLTERTGLSREKISALVLGVRLNALGWYNPQMNPEGRSGPLTGDDSPHADQSVYSFYHLSGDVFRGTRFTFKEKTGCGNIAALVTGKIESTQDGWAMSPENCSAWQDGIPERAQKAAEARGDIFGINNPRADQTIFDFVNTLTGETQTRKRADMAMFLGESSARMAGMLEGHYKIRGWTVKEFEDKKKIHLWKNRGSKLIIEKDGKELTGTRTELAKMLGVSIATVSAFANGRYKTCKGWTLVKQISE